MHDHKQICAASRISTDLATAAAAVPVICLWAVGGNVMSLGKRKTADFVPYLKYKATSGQFLLEERVSKNGTWENETRDVTAELRGVFDLETAERGWLRFPQGAAPELQMVPAGEDPGDAPSRDHREGFRLVLKLDLDDTVREFTSTAKSAWDAIDALHSAYLRDVPKHPGELPIVELNNVLERKNGSSSTYIPVFTITGWTPRPDDMPKTRRPSNSSNGTSRAIVKPNTLDDEIPF